MGPGGTRVGPGGTRMGPGGPGGTHEDLDGLRWKNMGAGCTSPGPSALLSAMSCDTVDLCGNCDKHGGAESRPKYEAVKQSPSRAIIISPPSPSSSGETSRASGCVAVACQSNLAVGEGGGARLRMLMRLVCGQVSGASKRFHM